ncbi:hypothetical protein Tco_1400464 [Tanacetum coccineum]
MSTLKFVDTHNMVAFLEKPAKSEGFEQIVDFLNASPIKYALTVNPTIYVSCIEQFWTTGEVNKVNGDAQIHALIDGKRIVVSEATIRRDLHLANEGGVDCLPTSTIFEEIARMGYEKPSQKLTFYKAFFSPQWKFIIHIILQCLSAKTTAWNEFSSTVASTIICLATNQKFNFLKYILEGMLRNLDAKAVKFLIYPRKPTRRDTEVSQPSKHVMVADEDVIVEKVTKQSNDPLSDVEKGKRQELPLLKRLYKVWSICKRCYNNEMFDVNDLARDEVVVETKAASKDVNLNEDENNTQAKIDADYELAQRLQQQEQEELTDAEKAKLFVQLLEARKKHSVEKRAKEQRSKPQTKAQKRKTMSTYPKNMAGWKSNQLKDKSFDEIQKLFDQAMKRVNSFVDMDTEVVEGSSKRAGSELRSESAKKQKADDDKETTELQMLVIISPDEEEVAVDAIPLDTKPLVIIDYKIHKEDKTSYYKITRVDGSFKLYKVFSQLLKSFDREDLETL